LGPGLKKKLKCLVCGEYNDVGNAKKITVPERQHRRPSSAVGRRTLDRLRQLGDFRAFPGGT